MSSELLKTVHLKPHEAKRLCAGHPWVYPSEIESIDEDIADGDCVQVSDSRNRLIGSGLYNSKSKIRVRLLSLRHSIYPDLNFFESRIENALKLRLRSMPGATSFRVVNAESDFLSGLIIDKYNDILVLQTTSLGMDQALVGMVETQKLLLSETLETGIKDAALLKERLPVFQQLGIGLHEFGEQTFLIDALPPFVKGVSAKQFILDLLDSLRSVGREIFQADLAMETIASHACRLAVKANDIIATEEIEYLMEKLRHCKMPYTCPHGRPTIIEISARELEKKFRRIV